MQPLKCLLIKQLLSLPNSWHFIQLKKNTEEHWKQDDSYELQSLKDINAEVICWSTEFDIAVIMKNHFP